MLHLSFPVFDANAGGADQPLGDLPEWNLDDLYTGEDAPELKRDLDWLEKACADFANYYEGKLADLNAESFFVCVSCATRKSARLPGGSCPSRACGTTS